MSDFIEEVEDQLRSERYRDLAAKALPWFAAALIAVVVGWLGVWGYHAWRDRDVARASIAYDKGLQALGQGDETGAFAAFAPLGKTGPAGYRTLALMQQGNIRLAANKVAEAVDFYDQAAKAAPNAIIGDLARLKAALALLDTAPYPQLETRLGALIGHNRPFDLRAREALAMAKLEAGKVKEARGDLNALTLTLGVSQATVQRARMAIAVIDSGQAGTIPLVVRAAATMPPSPPASVGPPQAPAPPQAAAPGEAGTDGTPQ